MVDLTPSLGPQGWPHHHPAPSSSQRAEGRGYCGRSGRVHLCFAGIAHSLCSPRGSQILSGQPWTWPGESWERTVAPAQDTGTHFEIQSDLGM